MKNYSIEDIIPDIEQSMGYYVGVFEETPDPVIEWPHRHNFYSLVWFKKGVGINVIDFNEHEISSDRIFTINPNQIHNWNYSIDSSGYFILIDSPTARHLNIEFSNPFIDLKEADLQFIDEIFKRMLTGTNQLSAISYLFSLLLSSETPNYHSNQIISEFKNLISGNLDKNLSIDQYADKLGIAAGTLNQTCKIETGLTAKQLQLELKITEAKRLLLYADFNYSEIAFKLGFEDSSYFSRIFKKKTDLSPTQFLEKYPKIRKKS
ncbi:AraC family transcriptional regulator [Sphingobacterium daejeonense]|uniref:helix-turn-helix domain-containing protein n=1 Tax=Sphingobacterium daejeonense TaxID=371142 RepID=UPI0021A3B39F|nr:AraC family transcriptional regulator [Sphingobacterium daejeonense]MCT1530528.1 AraC family transcriptional regulator [Sphingobacterium daejeonense]